MALQLNQGHCYCGPTAEPRSLTVALQRNQGHLLWPYSGTKVTVTMALQRNQGHCYCGPYSGTKATVTVALQRNQGHCYCGHLLPDADDYGAVIRMLSGRVNRSTRRKSAPVLLCPQMPQRDLISNPDLRGGSRQPIAWPEARPKRYERVTCVLEAWLHTDTRWIYGS
jgi:hypothetical protein